MAENEVENQGTENTEQATENTEVAAEETGLLTQDQVNAILQERINEIKEQSASELRQMREQAEAQIRGYQQAFNQMQTRQQSATEDDPAPPNMTKDQQIMWDANKPTRDYMRNQMAKMSSQVSQTVNPLLQDTTVNSFFRSKPGIPEALKAKTAAYFAEAVNDPNVTLKPEQVIQASYVRAMAAMYEAGLTGQNTQKAAAQVKPQPKVISPNGSADIGGGRRAIGMGAVGKKDQTWQEIQAELINSGKIWE
jgi:hypothetical protein